MKIRKNGFHMFIFVLAMSVLISWAAAAKTSEKWDATATARVNLRRNPGPNGVILSIVPQGHKVRIIEKKGLWCKVDVEGDIHGKGWVYAEFLAEILPNAPETGFASHSKEVLPKSLEPESASNLAETLPKALETESTSILEETLPESLATESASYLEEILPKALETVPASETLVVENTSGGQTQVIHPAKSPPKVRTADNKANLLNAAPPAMASQGDATNQLSMRNEFRSDKDKESFPLKISTADAKEQPPVRDEFQHASKELKALSPLGPPLPEEPVHLLATEPPYSGFTQDALGTVKESSLVKIKRRNTAIHHKNLPAGEMKHTGAIAETPFAFKEKAGTYISAVAASVRKKSAIRPEIIRPVKLAIKSLSIVLSCLVILLLHRENKTVTKRYIEQTEHPPAMHGAFD